MDVNLCIGARQCVRMSVYLFISTLAPLLLLPVNEEWTVVTGPIQRFHTGPLLLALSNPVPPHRPRPASLAL